MSYVRHAFVAAIGAFALILPFAASISITAQGQQPARTVQDGVYTDAQASRGQALYAQRCAGCHGPALAGAQAPPLTGEAFTSKFRTEPLSALFIKIRYTMPPPTPPPTPPATPPATPPPSPNATGAAQLTPEQGADLV